MVSRLPLRAVALSATCEETMESPTPEVIAQWMLDQIEQEARLYQADAATAIAFRFGREFVHENRNGRKAIDKRIVRAFRAAAGDKVIWNRQDFYWRLREAADWRSPLGE
jgi:hypothetical protein